MPTPLQNINAEKIKGDLSINSISATTYQNLPIDIRKNLQSGNINYCGYAPTGSLESQSVWTVTKITAALDGTVTTQTYNNVTWTSVPF